METSKIALFLLPLIVFCESANILYIMPFASKSHYIMLRPIGLELARRGHNVTVITSFSEKDHPPSYHEVMIDAKEIWDLVGTGRPNVFDMAQKTAEEYHKDVLWKGGLPSTEVALNSTDVKIFLEKDNQFDLVIAEQFFLEALNILAYKYQAPLVLVTTFGNCMKHNLVTRNPQQWGTVVHEYVDINNPTSFWGRMRNFYFSSYEYLWWRYWYIVEQDKLVKKYIEKLPEPVPSLYEVQQNASLMLYNGHFSFDAPMAYLPNIVEIGGIHVSESDSKLPKDLQELFDASPQSVVYVNFGSNVRSSELPEEKRDAFLNVFRRLKQTVLWKWEDDKLENIPENVVVRKWLPQKEILSHPNIKVFFSHGGLIGTQEAIFYGVPIIGVPIYADQYNNLLQAQDHGFGKILMYNDINENTLYSLLTEVLSNESFKMNAKEVSNRFKDRPMSPMHTAMYWIEHVIKYKGANCMKNPSIQLSWIAYTMMDVYAFSLSIVVAIIYLIFSLFKYLVTPAASETIKKKKKQQ